MEKAERGQVEKGESNRGGGRMRNIPGKIQGGNEENPTGIERGGGVGICISFQHSVPSHVLVEFPFFYFDPILADTIPRRNRWAPPPGSFPGSLR